MNRKSKFEIEIDRQIEEHKRIILQSTQVIQALEKTKVMVKYPMKELKIKKPADTLPLIPEEKP